ncbi:MAG: C-GCAxxG-C-C family (seleno)protein [Spirochaetales bacterium]|nr:C-GCAxxG-C-C family (seleno)protein [Spirochaetales bacterium]
MIKNYIEQGFGLKEDLSCSETILYAANTVHKLGLDKNSLKMAAGLSGGFYTQNICGALSAGAMVLSRIYIRDRAHESPVNGELVRELIEEYRQLMGSELCLPLKEAHRTEEEKCRPVIIAAAGVLDRIINREGIPRGE